MKPQIFNETIDESPSSTVDIEAIIVRERRSGRRRRLMGAGTAGLMVVGLASGAVAYAGNAGLGRSTTGRGDVPVTAPAPDASPWLPDVVVKFEENIRDVLPRVAPDARISETRRWTPADGPQLKASGQDGTTLFIEMYGWSYSVTLGTRGGGLDITLNHVLGGYDFPFTGCEHYSFGECEETTTSDGKRMLIHKTVSPIESDPTPEIVHRVLVDCGNGVAVEVSHSNRLAGAPNSDAPPLTLEQLKQIALCPAL